MNDLHIYNLPHTIFVIIVALIIAIQSIVLHKAKPSQNVVNIYSYSIASIILFCVIITRIFDTKYNIDNNIDNTIWLHVIPTTWCSLCGILYFVTVVFLKKKDKMLHFVGFLGLLGGLMCVLFPNFLSEIPFFNVRSFPSLIYHALMVILTLFLIQVKVFKPTFKKSK